MAKFKYYYDLMSQPCRALYIIFKMSGTPFEKCPIALLKGDHFKKSYKEINRFRKVPCIVTEDGFKLSETVAIIRYVDALGLISKKIYPEDIKDRSRIEEYMQWQHLNTRYACYTYLIQSLLGPLFRNQFTTPDELKISEKRVYETMDLIENIWLKDGKFLTGPNLSVADIMAACEIQSIYLANIDPTNGRPKLKKWLENVRNDTNPYFDEVHEKWQIKKMLSSNLTKIVPFIVKIKMLFKNKK